MEVLAGKLEGKILKNRYQIGEVIGKGQNGTVYSVNDTLYDKLNTKLVVKVVEKSKDSINEIKALIQMQK